MDDPAASQRLPLQADDAPEAGSVRRVALIGAEHPAGLSLALAWKAARPALVVTGLGAPDALEAAEATGALDHKAASLEAAAADADLVLLAGRLPTALRRLGELAPHLAPGILVTDTGAAKHPIARHAASVLPEDVSFVGGHPVAAPGSEARIDAARFDGGTYVLCPPEAEPTDHRDAEDALRTRHPGFFALAEATGAAVEVRSAARHDRLSATARDLPALLSAALARVASAEGDHALLHALTPPSYRALVWGREAPSPTQREELAGREGPLLDALGRYVRALQGTRRHLAAGDLDAALGTGDATNADA